MQLGPHTLRNNVFVAPMAGVTDRPFRQLCKALGAGYAVSEMAASNPRLWASVKTARRVDHAGEMEPRAVQIAGADPAMMAEAARFNVDRGAQVIDINMGCPAKKVCRQLSGSALMADEPLALAIIDAVASAVSVPVTVKMRTGPTPESRNVVRLARAAQSAGAAMITVHGRTRACGFAGRAEYDTISEVRSALAIPVVANGDIDSPRKAREVLERTGAAAVMIGRAAQGRPWIFREIAHFLATGEELAPPTRAEIHALLRQHLLDHYAFHGEFVGVRTARKHVGWYLSSMAGWDLARDRFNAIESPDGQLEAIDRFLAGTQGAHADGCAPDAANDTKYARRRIA
ncbi:MAG TPA: tRNA dihydrouridine synthase DusB [Burkholderiaceae bacterium]